jgi:hypothetical protein
MALHFVLMKVKAKRRRAIEVFPNFGASDPCEVTLLGTDSNLPTAAQQTGRRKPHLSPTAV